MASVALLAMEPFWPPWCCSWTASDPRRPGCSLWPPRPPARRRPIGRGQELCSAAMLWWPGPPLWPGRNCRRQRAAVQLRSDPVIQRLDGGCVVAGGCHVSWLHEIRLRLSSGGARPLGLGSPARMKVGNRTWRTWRSASASLRRCVGGKRLKFLRDVLRQFPCADDSALPSSWKGSRSSRSTCLRVRSAASCRKTHLPI